MAWRKPTNLREWLWILCRHQKKAFFPAVTVMIVVFLASHRMPRVYTAEARFQRVNDAALQQMDDRAIHRTLNPIRRALNEDLTGQQAIEQVIEDLGLTRSLPHTPDGRLTREGQLQKMDIVRRMQGRIRVWFAIQSDQVDQVVVSYTDSDRTLAPKVVNQLVENYIRDTRRQLDEMLLNAKSFFDNEVTRYRQHVTELEARKLRFEMDHPGLLPEDPASVQAKLVELRGQHRQTQQELRVTQEKHQSLKVWLERQPVMVSQQRRGQNPMLTDLIARRHDAEKELDTHLNQFGRTEDHPLVVKTRRRIADLEMKMSQTEAEVVVTTEVLPNQARLAAEQQIELLAGATVALTRQLQEQAAQIEQYEAMNRNFFTVRSDYVKIQREFEEAVRQLQFWEENLRQTTIALRAEIGQRGVRLSVLQRAPDVARPSKPTLEGIFMVALCLGLGTAAAIIFLAELIDRSFRSAEHALDELKLPVLGAVNEILSERQTMQRRVWNLGIYPAMAGAMALVLLGAMGLAYLSLAEPLRFDQLVHNPGQVLVEKWRGGP